MWRVNMSRRAPWQNYSSSRLRAKALLGKRPSLSVQRFCFAGVNSSGTISKIGLLVIVELIHPTSSKNYTKLAKCESKAAEYLEMAFDHALSLSMELQEVVVR